MNVKKIKVTKIEVTKYDFKTKNVEITIEIENENPIKLNFTLERNHHNIAENLVTEIKQKKKEKSLDFDDDILGSISVVHLQNDEEDMQEQVFKGLLRLEGKVKGLLANTHGPTYMNTLYSLQTVKETLYKSR